MWSIRHFVILLPHWLIFWANFHSMHSSVNARHHNIEISILLSNYPKNKIFLWIMNENSMLSIDKRMCRMKTSSKCQLMWEEFCKMSNWPYLFWKWSCYFCIRCTFMVLHHWALFHILAAIGSRVCLKLEAQAVRVATTLKVKMTGGIRKGLQ